MIKLFNKNQNFCWSFCSQLAFYSIFSDKWDYTPCKWSFMIWNELKTFPYSHNRHLTFIYTIHHTKHIFGKKILANFLFSEKKFKKQTKINLFFYLICLTLFIFLVNLHNQKLMINKVSLISISALFCCCLLNTFLGTTDASRCHRQLDPCNFVFNNNS